MHFINHPNFNSVQQWTKTKIAIKRLQNQTFFIV
ncbi:Uncharacterised protein [Vibrio cholerae]|nr:Uncharacterised protein [Vibrio cholerae]